MNGWRLHSLASLPTAMPESADWWGFALIFIVYGSLTTQRPGLETRGVNDTKALFLTYACAPLMCALRYGGCARETSMSAGFCPFTPGFQPAYSCHPFAWKPNGAAKTR